MTTGRWEDGECGQGGGRMASEDAATSPRQRHDAEQALDAPKRCFVRKSWAFEQAGWRLWLRMENVLFRAHGLNDVFRLLRQIRSEKLIYFPG